MEDKKVDIESIVDNFNFKITEIIDARFFSDREEDSITQDDITFVVEITDLKNKDKSFGIQYQHGNGNDPDYWCPNGNDENIDYDNLKLHLKNYDINEYYYINDFLDQIGDSLNMQKEFENYKKEVEDKVGHSPE